DVRLRIVLPAVSQNLKAVAIGKADVGQDQIESSLAKLPQGRITAAGGKHFIVLLAQPRGHRVQDQTVVVNQKEGSLLHRYHPRGVWWGSNMGRCSAVGSLRRGCDWSTNGDCQAAPASNFPRRHIEGDSQGNGGGTSPAA